MAGGPYILAIDLGTSGAKTVLFSHDLKPISQAFSAYETKYSRPGWAEQETEDWWEALSTGIGSVLSAASIAPSEIAVFGIDAMTPVLVAVDGEGRALRPAIIWMDRRASEPCAKIEATLSRELSRISGNHNDPSNFAPKVMWLKENEPELYRRTAVFHHANGYLVHRITGEHTLDKTQCGLSQLCDTRSASWSDELIEGCGLDRAKLPEIVESTKIVGSVTENAARELGLAAGIPVIAGSMDNVAAGLGLGIHRHGEIYVSAGTATNVCLCINEPFSDPSFHLYSHIIPGTYLCVAGVDFGGAGLKWFKEILGDVSYEELGRAAKECRDDFSRPLVFLPYMVGQRAPLWNSDTRGVLFGLEPGTGRGELARSFMEGNALGVKRIFDLFEKHGYRVSESRLTGGAAESDVYAQVFADVTASRMSIVAEKDVATQGIAMAAAYGAKLYSDFDSMIAKAVTTKTVEPASERAAYYHDLRSLFDSLFDRLTTEYMKLGEIKRKHFTGR